MKKTFFLIITLCVMGITIAYSQDMAKLEQLHQEVERITATAEARGGTYTPQELQRIQQLQQEMIQLLGGAYMTPDQLQQSSQQTLQQMQQAQQMQQPEEQRRQGWPPAAAWNFVRITLRQPTGMTVSYVNGKPATGNIVARNEWEGFEIFMTGNNLDTAFQNLKQQIESATGERMNGSGDSYSIGMRPPNNNYTSTTIELRLIRGTRESQLELTFRTSTVQ